MDFKNFIYLNDSQRIYISIALALSLIFSICVVGATVTVYQNENFRLFGLEVFKITSTASAVWVLVLLHTSSNSKKRINQEIDRFLAVDIIDAFKALVTPVKGYPLDPLNVDLKLEVIVRTSNSVICKLSDKESEIFFYCRVTLSEIIVLFYLPEEYSENWRDTHKAAFDFWDQNNVKYANVGVRTANWHPQMVRFTEISVVRSISRNFLFDAIDRIDTSEKIIGDARAFLICRKEK